MAGLSMFDGYVKITMNTHIMSLFPWDDDWEDDVEDGSDPA